MGGLTELRIHGAHDTLRDEEEEGMEFDHLISKKNRRQVQKRKTHEVVQDPPPPDGIHQTTKKDMERKHNQALRRALKS